MKKLQSKQNGVIMSLIALCLIILVSCSNNNDSNYLIRIKLENVESSAQVFLSFEENTHVDTLNANAEGEFLFQGTVSPAQRAYLELSHGTNEAQNSSENKDRIIVFLEKGELLIEGKDSLITSTVSGTPLNDEFGELLKILRSSEAKINKLVPMYYKAVEAQDLQKKEKLINQLDSLVDQQNKQELAFIKEHSNSLVSLYWLKDNFNVITDRNMILEIFHQFSDELKNSTMGLEYSNVLKNVKPVDINFEAPDFSATQPNGEEVSLSSFRGKYVLLDFWASWCGPCRQENPNLVKVFNSYKNKRFTIVGFSLDEGENAHKRWTSAIEDDGLAWAQLSELNGWESKASLLYGINSVPTNFLIDPQGIIVAKNLFGDELEAKLKEILK